MDKKSWGWEHDRSGSRFGGKHMGSPRGLEFPGFFTLIELLIEN